MTPKGEPRLLDMIVLEQFVEGLPADITEWACCCRPAGLDITVMRSEDHLLAKRVWEAAATGSGKSTSPYYSNAAPGPMTTMACCCRAAPTSIE